MSGARSECGERRGQRAWDAVLQVALLVLLFFVVAGDPPPGVNEAHYLVLAKNYWQPEWCSGDLFVVSNKPHVLFHATFGALSQINSLEVAAWIGRLIGWTMLATTLAWLCRCFSDRLVASLLVATIWIAGMEWFNLAGEWVVGGIEAKVPAYALVLAALARIAKGAWHHGWPLLGAASAFHVLVGGWTVVAVMFAYLSCGRRDQPLRRQLGPLLVGGAVALMGLGPALAMSVAEAPHESLLAARIYTYARLSHHLVPSSFPATWFVRHGALLVATALLAWPLRREQRFRRVAAVALGCVLIALIGLVLGLLPKYDEQLAARLLRFYWFRATDAITPLLLGLAAAIHLGRRPVAWPEISWWGGNVFPGVLSFAVSVVALGLLASSTVDNARRGIPVACRFDRISPQGHQSHASQRQAFDDWLRVCDWIRQTFPADEVLLTPRHQQTFKWYANRAEVVNWKDVPQDAESLVRWYRRFFDVYPQRLGTIRVTIRYAELQRYRQQYGVHFMVVDRRVVGEQLPLVQVYPQPGDESANRTYAVYRLPERQR